MTLSDLYYLRDNLNKEIYNTFDSVQLDLLKNRLMEVNCRIIKRVLKNK